MSHFRRAALTAGLALIVGQTASAQTSALYLTGNAGVHVYQGGTEINSWGHATGEQYDLMIAVSGDVRTTGYQPGSNGSQYTLGGVYTGTNYASSLPGYAYDGTSDGNQNFAALYGNGQLYGADRNWANSTFLFAIDANDLGVTYDGTTNTIWTSSYYDGTISNYSMSGTLLSQFNSGLGYFYATVSLAYDSADQSLWLYSRFGDNMMHQYSTAGVHLSSFDPGLLGRDDVLGGEFDTAATVPEPASVVLVASGLVAVFGAARRRNRKA